MATINNTSRLASMLKSPFRPALKEGVYNVNITKYSLEESPTTKVPYIRIELVTLDEEQRTIIDNRFDNNFGVMISHLRQQLNKADETVVPETLLNDLITNKTPLKIWVTKAIVGASQRTNINYIKPLDPVKPNTDVVDDTTTDAKPELTPITDEKTPF